MEVFGTIEDNISTCGGITAVHVGGRFNTVGGRFNTVGGRFNTVGDTFSTVKVVQCSGG